MKDRLKYVIDSRYFDGTCLTSMSDGFHNDYGGETIEELRIRENNPYLKAVTPSKKFTLLIWLTDNNDVQDETDAGKSFSADITYRTSEGGRLTASVDGKQAENSDPSNNT